MGLFCLFLCPALEKLAIHVINAVFNPIHI